MATPAPLTYYLLAAPGLYYTELNGIVSTTTIPTPIQAPKKWIDTETVFERNQRMHGVFRTITTAYQFAGNGATILRHLYYTKGVKATCLFVIKELDHALNQWNLVDNFSGQISFRMFSDTQEGVNATAIETGIGQKLSDNENTPYEIPVLDLDAVRVRMDGINLQSSYTFISQAADPAPVGIDANDRYFLPVGAAASEATDYFQNYITTQLQEQHFDISDPNKWAMRILGIDLNATIDLEYDIEYAAQSVLSPVRLRIMVDEVDFGTSSATNHVMYTDPNTVANLQSRRVQGTATLSTTLHAGRHIKIELDITNGNVTAGQSVSLKIYNLKLSIRGTSRLPESIAKGYRFYQLFYKVAEQVAGTSGLAYSDFLTNHLITRHGNTPQRTIAIPGESLRGINGPRIKASLADIHKAAAAQWGLGLGIDSATGRLIMEPVDYFYQDVEICDLGVVTKVEVEPATDYFFGQMRIGYPAENNNDVNGRDEFNATAVYSTGFTQAKEEMDKVSPFSASMYTIEHIRSRMRGKDTTDSSADNAVFLTEVAQAPLNGIYQLYRPNTAANTSGIMFPDTAYNVTLSPARMALRNSSLLRSLYHLDPAGYMQFQSHDRNREMKALGIDEDADIAVSDMDAPVFQPVLFKFLADPPYNLTTLLKNNPYGYITFRFRERVWKGFIIRAGFKPATREAYNFTLLSHPDNDLSYLRI